MQVATDSAGPAECHRAGAEVRHRTDSGDGAQRKGAGAIDEERRVVRHVTEADHAAAATIANLQPAGVDDRTTAVGVVAGQGDLAEAVLLNNAQVRLTLRKVSGDGATKREVIGTIEADRPRIVLRD